MTPNENTPKIEPEILKHANVVVKLFNWLDKKSNTLYYHAYFSGLLLISNGAKREDFLKRIAIFIDTKGKSEK